MNIKNQKTNTLSISVFDSVSVSEELIKINIILIWITEQSIRYISTFLETLKRIHIRLISEGYLIKDGTITKPVDKSQIN